MLEVNLREVRSLIDDYNQLLEQIEDNNNNIIKNFNDLNNFWYDKNILELKSSVQTETRKAEELKKSIKNQVNVYKTIEKGYEKIGKKVKCNLNSKRIINTKLDSVISKLKTVISDYNSLGDISFYSRSNMIIDQRDRLISILETFKTIKTEINNKFKQIEDIEQEVADKLDSFEIERITKADIEVGTLEKVVTGSKLGILLDEVQNSNERLNSYILEEQKIDFALKDLGGKVGSLYKSNNSNKIKKYNEQISNSEYSKLGNLKNYKQYIDDNIVAYREVGESAEVQFAKLTNELNNQK